jgi:hypothetical protein
MLKMKAVLATLALTAVASQAHAGFSVMVGDADGYGYGRPDVSTGIAWPGPGSSGENYDGRDAAEMAATNGAQITDSYSALFPGFGPNASESADVLFPFSGTLGPGAKIKIAMGDFQASTFGPISANINGSPISMAFDDGFQNSTIRTFHLDAAAIAAANAAQEVVLHLDHTGSGDFIAFDWFQLNSVPEPATWAMLILGMGAIGGAIRRKAALAS